MFFPGICGNPPIFEKSDVYILAEGSPYMLQGNSKTSQTYHKTGTLVNETSWHYNYPWWRPTTVCIYAIQHLCMIQFANSIGSTFPEERNKTNMQNAKNEK